VLGASFLPRTAGKSSYRFGPAFVISIISFRYPNALFIREPRSVTTTAPPMKTTTANEIGVIVESLEMIRTELPTKHSKKKWRQIQKGPRFTVYTPISVNNSFNTSGV